MSIKVEEKTVAAPSARPRKGTSGGASRWVNLLAFDKIGAIYVWIAIVVVFAFWAPDTFPNITTAKQILNSNAITGLAALAVTIPLAARVFDLSFALNMTLCGVAVAHFVVDGLPLGLALALGLLIGLVVGLINATVVVVMKIDSFIATLATGSLIQALITLVTNDTPISDSKLSGGFSKIGQTTVGGITLPVLYFAAVAVAIWYLLEHTATGRRLYATGFNPDAARLAGVSVARLQFMALVTSGVLSGATGIVLASILGGGSPTAGTPYLLPGFAAVFLGATQLKNGRFNAGGTIIAVLLLGTGTTGLGLANAPQWSGALFVGIVLIAALMVTGLQRRTTLPRVRRTSDGRPSPPQPATTPSPGFGHPHDHQLSGRYVHTESEKNVQANWQPPRPYRGGGAGGSARRRPGPGIRLRLKRRIQLVLGRRGRTQGCRGHRGQGVRAADQDPGDDPSASPSPRARRSPSSAVASRPAPCRDRSSRPAPSRSAGRSTRSRPTARRRRCRAPSTRRSATAPTP